MARKWRDRRAKSYAVLSLRPQTPPSARIRQYPTTRVDAPLNCFERWFGANAPTPFRPVFTWHSRSHAQPALVVEASHAHGTEIHFAAPVYPHCHGRILNAVSAYAPPRLTLNGWFVFFRCPWRQFDCAEQFVLRAHLAPGSLPTTTLTPQAAMLLACGQALRPTADAPQSCVWSQVDAVPLVDVRPAKPSFPFPTFCSAHAV